MLYSKKQIVLIVGPMFSGKTTELIRLFDRTKYAKQKSIMVKPKLDTRYADDKVVNHNKENRLAFVVSNMSELEKIIDTEKPDNVFIDEGQFFESELISFVKDWSNKGYNFYISMLNQTSEGIPFPFTDNKDHVGSLMALADLVINVNAICCICGKPATKSFKLKTQGKTIELGSTDIYEPRCNEHWHPVK